MDSENTNVARINRVIAEQLGINESDIKPNSEFVDDLGADSLDSVELVMALEDEFELEISDELAETWVTPKHIYDYFDKRSDLESVPRVNFR